MNATPLAHQFAAALLTHQLHAEAFPAPTPNGYGHKIAVSLPDGNRIGSVVVYAGKHGPRYTTNELTLLTPEILERLGHAWASLTSCHAERLIAPPPAPHTTATLTVPPGMAELWVDGACLEDPSGLRFGWAYVIRQDDRELAREASSRILPYMAEHRNVSAELQAVIAGLEHCRQLGLTAVTIFFDYQGIESWGIGTWKTNTRTTQEYQQYVRACPMTLVWRKIQAHSGVPMNELVDSLANSAASTSVERHRLPAPSPSTHVSPRS